MITAAGMAPISRVSNDSLMFICLQIMSIFSVIVVNLFDSFKSNRFHTFAFSILSQTVRILKFILTARLLAGVFSGPEVFVRLASR